MPILPYFAPFLLVMLAVPAVEKAYIEDIPLSNMPLTRENCRTNTGGAKSGGDGGSNQGGGWFSCSVM
jgi:hypothetical protein